MTTAPSDMDQRIQRVLGELGAEHSPPAGWETRVLSAIAEQRIGDQLARLGEDHAPAAGWEDRVIAATRSKPRRRAWWVAMPAAAAAAAGMLWLAVPPALAKPVIYVQRVGGSSATKRGGHDVAVGEDIEVSSQSDAPYHELWIYHGDKLFRRCPGQGRPGDSRDCTYRGDKVITVLRSVEHPDYHPVAVASKAQIPEPRTTEDKDTNNAQEAGALVNDQLPPINPR